MLGGRARELMDICKMDQDTQVSTSHAAEPPVDFLMSCMNLAQCMAADHLNPLRRAMDTVPVTAGCTHAGALCLLPFLQCEANSLHRQRAEEWKFHPIS